MHKKLCERHQRRARTTRDRGVRLQHRTTRWQQSGVGRVGRDIPAPRVDSAPHQQEQQRPLTAPRTARKYPKDALVQTHASTTADDDATNARPRSGLGSSGVSTTGDTTGDGGENTAENATIVASASDGRIACSNCRRWFSSDRVGVHQDICRRVNKAAPSPDGDSSRSGTEEAVNIEKTASSSSSSVRFSRRRSSCPAFGGNRTAMARACGAWGRSAGLEKRSNRDRYAIDRAGERMISPSSHSHEMRWSPQLDAWSQGEAKQHRTGEQQKKERKPAAAPGGENSGQHQPARRPSSATGGRAWPFDAARSLAPAAGNRSRLYAGHAVSTSCSPVRLRRGSASSTAVRPAGGERPIKRGSVVVGTGVRGFYSGSRRGDGDHTSSSFAFARKTKLSGQGVPDGGIESERLLLGGKGFFSPSRDERQRVRLLRS